jgi:hypothetical protein
MPQYFFHIRNGQYSGGTDHCAEIADRDAAWKELTGVCGDMVSGISRKLTENGRWSFWTNPKSRSSESAWSPNRWIRPPARREGCWHNLHSHSVNPIRPQYRTPATAG